METGKLRTRATIEQVTESQNNIGEAIETWSTFKDWRCDIRHLRGQELFGAQQVQSEVVAEARGRYISGVAPKMRLVVGSTTYNIVLVDDVRQRGRELRLMLSAGLRD